MHGRPCSIAGVAAAVILLAIPGTAVYAPQGRGSGGCTVLIAKLSGPAGKGVTPSGTATAAECRTEGSLDTTISTTVKNMNLPSGRYAACCPVRNIQEWTWRSIG
jgi:hypothetical protein